MPILLVQQRQTKHHTHDQIESQATGLRTAQAHVSHQRGSGAVLPSLLLFSLPEATLSPCNRAIRFDTSFWPQFVHLWPYTFGPQYLLAPGSFALLLFHSPKTLGTRALSALSPEDPSRYRSCWSSPLPRVANSVGPLIFSLLVRRQNEMWRQSKTDSTGVTHNFRQHGKVPVSHRICIYISGMSFSLPFPSPSV